MDGISQLINEMFGRQPEQTDLANHRPVILMQLPHQYGISVCEMGLISADATEFLYCCSCAAFKNLIKNVNGERIKKNHFDL